MGKGLTNHARRTGGDMIALRLKRQPKKYQKRTLIIVYLRARRAEHIDYLCEDYATKEWFISTHKVLTGWYRGKINDVPTISLRLMYTYFEDIFRSGRTELI